MKISSLFVAPVLLSACLAQAQDLVESDVRAEKVPEVAIASAVRAVGELGQSVVQGKYQVALERMNPKEKERLAKQMGGLDKLEKQLAAVPAEMVRQGVKVVSSKPQGKPVAYGVVPQPTILEENGRKVQRMRYTQWLVMVPTITKFHVWNRTDPTQPDELIEIESLSFQVAVSDRGKEDWTFIDGAGLTIGRLRNLYGTLPANIQLPEVHKRQIQK